MSDNDVTGWCRSDQHQVCSGELSTATGSHWWCACLCHPERSEADASRYANPQSVAEALATFRAAREALEAFRTPGGSA